MGRQSIYHYFDQKFLAKKYADSKKDEKSPLIDQRQHRHVISFLRGTVYEWFPSDRSKIKAKAGWQKAALHSSILR